MSSVASADTPDVESIVQLTSGSEDETGPVWSPDGAEIAYYKNGNIYKRSATGLNEVALTSDSYNKGSYSWSPDGNKLVYVYDNDEIWTMNEDGSSKMQVAIENKTIRSCAWSPDGTKIAYTCGSGIIVIGPDGSDKQLITTIQDIEYIGRIAWSPDSSKLAFQEIVEYEEHVNNVYLGVINSDGTDRTLINGHPGELININQQTQSWQSQVWSPDGSEILYDDYNIYGSNFRQIFKINSDGSGSTLLSGEFDRDEEEASFSPDGNKIVYSSIDYYGMEADIWTMDADGNNYTQLTANSSKNTHPVWSPDGTKIAFESNRAGNYDIWVITLTGNNETPLPPSPEITGVTVEPQVLFEGDNATIKISVTNNGGSSSNGFISVSFPDNEEIIDVSGTGSDYNKLFPVGSPIVTSTGSSMISTDPLVELHDLDWDSNQTETLTIKVKTNEGASELRFYVRATLREEDVANYIRTPVSSSINDQQGFYVNDYSVDVTTQVLTPTITSITPNPATVGASVSFSGTGTSAYGEIVGYRWTSDLGGQLSTSASFNTSSLSVGSHIISFSIQDDAGLWSDAATRTLIINEATNQAPTASIVSISPNPVVEGTNVFFSGNGEDSDGTISNWKWESSIDGNLSSSASFSTSNLSVGTHTIYFSVCDDDNEWSEEVSSNLSVTASPAQNGNDSVAPVLVSVTPSDGTILNAGTTSVEIRFNYRDEQSNISSSSVVFTFDNIDVTDDANTTITDSYALYNASGLSTGSHSASVYVMDNSGNAVTFSTSFTISEARRSSSSSGGGGGGGGGSTGEKYANIADKEVDSVFVSTGAHVVYGFSNEGNPITTVEFDSKKTVGTIQATVEVLKDTSALVEEDAPGEIYQRMNIWVGKVGYATDSNVENMIVTFKVEKSWLDENNVPAESVSLCRYSDDAWNLLPADITREDDEYVYFSSSTPGFSPFAISGEAEETVMSTTDEAVNNDVAEQADVQDEDAEATSSGVSAAGLVMILILLSAILIGGYALSKKKG